MLHIDYHQGLKTICLLRNVLIVIVSLLGTIEDVTISLYARHISAYLPGLTILMTCGK
jgi:hypothetical protein